MKTTFGAWLLGVCGSIAILVGCSSAAQDSDRAGAESGGASTAETAGAAHTAGAGDRTPSTDESSAGAEAGAGGSNAGSSHGDAAAACEEYAVALCHKIAICNAWLLAAEFADEAACVKRWGTAGGCVGSFALVGTSRTVDRLAACTSAMNRATCAEWLDSDPVALAACSAKPGSLSDGMGCGDDAQCRSAHCRRNGDCGVCGPAPGPGDACSGLDECAPGLSCSDSVCQQAKVAGDRCERRADCPNSLACNAGRCASPRSAGEDCTEDACDDHAGFSCASGTCRRTRYAAPGEACDWSAGLDCGAGGFCRGSESSSDGTCVAPAKDGQSCDDAHGPRCLPWATCADGYCKLPNDAACH